MPQLTLPDPPARETGPVRAWSQPITIPTYEPLAPERHAMFLERRVYQGSNGKVYPLPFFDRIAEQPRDVQWNAVHMENEYLRVMILPELGGRIHVARDKTNGYDFVYRQDVIKPALVGLAGPWASGGIEFNWPQHHRPSTYMPTDIAIEREPDGAVTVWCSEHEPMNRMMGTHGIRLRPGRSTLELRVRLYNRTPLTQTFLWWANVATEVNEWYQSFFPPDVRHVADHAKRATSTFPRCSGTYYGVDYARRAREGVPEAERPSKYAPPEGLYTPDDLSWYANIPVPTSYMIAGTNADFFGGYDHRARAGIVHVANHHVAPGKKQWTWGNHAFGYAWDRNLTDPDDSGACRPYIELMAGVFTDNQPDFSFLAPGETRTFTQCWYPIRNIGPAVQANEDFAVSLVRRDGQVRVGVAATGAFARARVAITCGGAVVHEQIADLSPDRPLTFEFALASGAAGPLALVVTDASGRERLTYAETQADAPAEVPAPATEPASPGEMTSNDELYLTGLHLDQYRHPTRRADDYWREALRRDAQDSRCLTALGDWHLRRGEFDEAVRLLRSAVDRLTHRNPNPREGEAHYLLGVALRFLGREDQAYDAFYKSTWNAAWQSPAYVAIAELDCRRERWGDALRHLELALRTNADCLAARDLKAIVLRRMGREEEARATLEASLRINPLDFMAQHLLGRPLACGTSIRLDLAFDLRRAGFLMEAIELLRAVSGSSDAGTAPIVHYLLASMLDQQGNASAAADARRSARSVDAGYCFPSRPEEIGILQDAMAADPRDARAAFLLGNLFYDRRRHAEPIELWQRTVEVDPSNAFAWRNLGIGYFNNRADVAAALDAYERATAAAPDDARLLFERDQLWKRTGVGPARRLQALESRLALAMQRDDLRVELASLYNLTAQHDRAAEVLASKPFQPWEGGEGQALGQFARTCLAKGRAALSANQSDLARAHVQAALTPPPSLGEARHLLANASDVHYWIGRACAATGDVASSSRHYGIAAEARGDFQEMAVRSYSEMTYYSALALRALGRSSEADSLMTSLLRHAEELERTPAKIDYFATSLPTLLLFADDLDVRQRERAAFLRAQALIGLGKTQAGQDVLRKIIQANPNHADAVDLLNDSSAAEPSASSEE